VEVEDRPYAVPLMHTDTVLALQPGQLSLVGGVLVTNFQGQTVPVVPLTQLLHDEGEGPLPLATRDALQGSQQVLVVNYNNRRLGLLVDRFLRQQNIVIKPLSKPLDTIDLFGGVTLLGSGQVCLVLDVPALTRLFLNKRP
jgi:two-component system chemotaxis sensor kinase CheA